MERWGTGWSASEVNRLYDRAERKVEQVGEKGGKKDDNEGGGEWSTRIVPAYFKSSEMYYYPCIFSRTFTYAMIILLYV